MREESKVFEAELNAAHERYKESVDNKMAKRKVIPNLVLTKG